MKILHVLNGDSTLIGFDQTGIEGKIVIWREVLSEGPVEEDIKSGAFWKARAEWISNNTNETDTQYQQKVLDELARLTEDYDEINLWFEFDLHCQVNLLGVINYLKQSTDLSLPAIYLICPSMFPGLENFRGMGELNGDQLAFLYDNIRVQLNDVDLIVAADAWACYVKKDAHALSAYLASDILNSNLKCLQPALKAQLHRLQINKNGLNYIEQRLLDIYNTGVGNVDEIYTRFWENEKIYGMGDWELNMYLNRLRDKKLIA